MLVDRNRGIIRGIMMDLAAMSLLSEEVLYIRSAVNGS